MSGWYVGLQKNRSSIVQFSGNAQWPIGTASAIANYMPSNQWPSAAQTDQPKKMDEPTTQQIAMRMPNSPGEGTNNLRVGYHIGNGLPPFWGAIWCPMGELGGVGGG